MLSPGFVEISAELGISVNTFGAIDELAHFDDWTFAVHGESGCEDLGEEGRVYYVSICLLSFICRA